MTVETDIIVIGGGAAGIAAAISAASEKRKVVLLDKNNTVGGDSIHVNVGTICGAFYRSFSGVPTSVGYPFCKFLLSRLNETDQTAHAREYTEGLYIIPYEKNALRNVYETCLHEVGVDVHTNCLLEGVHLQGRKIKHLAVRVNGEPATLTAHSIVDCSGNAIVSQLAGIEIHQEESYQAAAQIFRVAGISHQNDFMLNMAIKKAILKKFTEKDWPRSYKALSIVPGSLRNGKVDLKLTLPETITADTLRSQRPLAESGRHVHEIFEVLKSDVESFHDAVLETNLPQPGIRVLQRSKGKYTLTAEDVLSCKKSGTSIATGTWPIEEWDNQGQVKMEYFEADNGYSIPANCIISEAVDNLFFAGKNISATSRAIASARVIGTGLQTGYAAGKLACGKTSDEQQIVSSLHHELERF